MAREILRNINHFKERVHIDNFNATTMDYPNYIQNFGWTRTLYLSYIIINAQYISFINNCVESIYPYHEYNRNFDTKSLYNNLWKNVWTVAILYKFLIIYLGAKYQGYWGQIASTEGNHYL